MRDLMNEGSGQGSPGRHGVGLIERQRGQPEAAKSDADTSNAVALKRHLQGTAGGWIGRRRALESDEGPDSFQRSAADRDARDQLADCEIRRISVGQEVAHFHAAPALRPFEQNLAIERNQKRRPTTARVCLRERSSDRAHVANLGIGNAQGAVADNGKLSESFRSSDLCVACQCSDFDRLLIARNIVGVRNPPEINDELGLQEPQLKHWNQGLAARENLRAGAASS